MFFSRTSFSRLPIVGGLALAAILILGGSGPTTAQPPPGSSKMWPWNVPGYEGYTYPKDHRSSPTTPEPIRESAPPRQYTLQMTVLPQTQKNTEENPNTVLLVAHVPEDAEIWFDDAPTVEKGQLREFLSPPLTPGKAYTYTVRVAWSEEGGKVAQTHAFPVRAGDIQCIDVVKAHSPAVQEKVKTALATLSPEDRKLAEEQKFCAVQEGIPLGAMGTPVKVMVKGQPVFLCCAGCEDKANGKPDQTLAKVQKLKEKHRHSPEK
jgi:uncharacterized protein (TIGR03000 family)